VTELALDRLRRETLSQRSKFARVRNAQRAYEQKLRRVAQTVGLIVQGYAGEDPIDGTPELRRALRQYSVVLSQWARRAAASMLSDVLRRDENAWAEAARGMQRALRSEIRSAPTGAILRELMEEQVALITSLPLEAAERVHSLALRGMETGARADVIAREILRTGEVTKSRAALIARTETTRASTNLLQARAEHVGSEGYIWRTSEDADVRPLHRKLNGQFFRWTEPPIAAEPNIRAHAGAIFNCRCWPEPMIPEERP
jgi:SPP1 gp7 family putative phage head morphogenesis protein